MKPSKASLLRLCKIPSCFMKLPYVPYQPLYSFMDCRERARDFQRPSRGASEQLRRISPSDPLDPALAWFGLARSGLALPGLVWPGP